MHKGELVRHWLDQGGGLLEEVGRRLLNVYQVVSSSSRGFIPYRNIDPRVLGAGGGLVACVLVVVLLAGSYHGVRAFLVGAPSSSGPGVPRVEFLICCEKCGRQQRVEESELGSLRSREGEYWCEKCRAYSAYRERVGNPCVATPPAEGATP